MRTKIFLPIGLMTLLTLLFACNGGKMEPKASTFPQIKDVSPELWKKLSQKKIYFGHQSVGFNIIDGIRDVMKENPQIKLNIMQTSDPSDFNGAIFGHATVGQNMDPESKIDSFSALMEKGIGDKVDIAFFKFCYVDIRADSNPEKVYNLYLEAISKLEKEYSSTIFIHVTSPLKELQTGPKALIKKVLGKPLSGYSGNVKRNEFNQLLGKNFQGRVFDLAKIESTFPDGTRSSFSNNGNIYYSLVPEYSNDGGHLNEKGRKIVAEQFLIFLANLAK